MHFLRISAAAISAAVTLTAVAQEPIRADWNIREHMAPSEVIVQSHRGAGELAPENTLEAFELGWTLKTIPEADVRTTIDGVIVTFHDKNFKRVVENVTPELAEKGAEDLTWPELKKLNVGSEMRNNVKGHHVGQLDDVFALMEGKPERRLYLDIKKVDFKQLAKLVKKHNIGKQVILASPKHDQIVEWKSLVPESDTLLWVSGDTEAVQAEKYEAAKARNFEGITQVQIHTHMKDDASSISRESVNPFSPSDKFLVDCGKELRSRGILFQTLPYGGTTQGVYWKLLDLGLMSFATDHPDVTQKAIADYYKLPDAPKQSPARADTATSTSKN